MMEFGIVTFAETTTDARTGKKVPSGERLCHLIEEIELADRVGLDVYGVGEHHRPDFAASAPAVILGAAAARTSRIKLTSAVTVLSSDDPVRVYQQFATVDLLSNGRAEIMAGRGSFIESFPLFGQSLDDYDELFAQNLELLLRVRYAERVTWPAGKLRPAIDDRGVYPRAEHEIPIWIAVGGTPQSVVRAASLGLPLALAIIGGRPASFVPLVNLYREAGRRANMPTNTLAVGINVHGFIADTAEAAIETFYPSYADVMTRIGRERGWPPLSRAQFDASTGPEGHLFIGSPDQVAAKIVALHRLFNLDRFLMHLTVGTMPHDAVMRAIELFGTKVAPAVRAALAESAASAGPTGPTGPAGAAESDESAESTEARVR
jgi:probable LLM family oxidoreductase